MGLYFEEFTLDRPVTTRGRTVSEADIVTFAGVSRDCNPLHIDEEFSKNAGYGGRIAHGPMSMSMAIGLMAQQNQTSDYSGPGCPARSERRTPLNARLYTAALRPARFLRSTPMQWCLIVDLSDHRIE
jgi:acyl dehydratase